MGIYSTTRYSSIDAQDEIQFEAAEGYAGDVGFAIAALESYQNDMAIFNGIIASDFQEACLIQEGASAEEIYVLQEGVLASAWEKIKEFFIKLWGKVKAIFKAFIAKIEVKFAKDNKKLFTKYEKEINEKDLDGFSIKVAAPAGDEVAIGFKPWDLNIADSVTKETLDNFDGDEYFKTIVKDNVGFETESKKTFEEDYFKKVFKDEADTTFTAGEITGDSSWVKKALTSDTGIKQIKEANKKLEQNIATIIKTIDGEIKKVKSAKKDKDYKGDLKKINTVSSDGSEANTTSTETGVAKDQLEGLQASYELARRQSAAIQDAVLCYSHTSIKAFQYRIAQARKVLAAAIAFRAPKKAEDAKDKAAEATSEAVEYAAMFGQVAFDEAWEELSDYSATEEVADEEQASA